MFPVHKCFFSFVCLLQGQAEVKEVAEERGTDARANGQAAILQFCHKNPPPQTMTSHFATLLFFFMCGDRVITQRSSRHSINCAVYFFFSDLFSFLSSFVFNLTQLLCASQGVPIAKVDTDDKHTNNITTHASRSTKATVCKLSSAKSFLYILEGYKHFWYGT